MKSLDFIKMEEFQSSMEELEKGYASVINYLYHIDERIPIDKEENEYVYFRIDELGYENNEQQIDDVIYAVYALGIPFSVIFKCVKGMLEIYFGTRIELSEALYDILNGSFWVNSSQMERRDRTQMEFIGKREVFDKEFLYSGIIRGGIKKKEKGDVCTSVIDSIMSGVRGEDFSIVVTSKPFSRQDIITLINDWRELKTLGEIIKSRQVSLHDELHSVSYTDISHKVLNYLEIIEKFYNLYNEALGNGLWESNIKYFADNEIVLKSVSGIMISKLFSEDSAEVIHCMQLNRIKYNDDLIISRSMVKVDNGPEMIFPAYSSFLSSNELAVIIELPRFDTIGLPVRKNVRFDLAQNETGDVIIGQILQSRRTTKTSYYIDSNELNRHALIVGLTGAGKTNSIKSILLEIKRRRNLPFLIVEPAKKEYWELYKLGCDDLKIYSLKKSNMLYINPFQKVGNVTVQTHIDYLFAAFKASFIMYPPMPYVLERAIYSVYEDCGWDITKDSNSLGENYPTIEQLYYKIPVIVEKMGYDIREQKNIIGALQARINSLRLGVKGQSLNIKQSTNIEKILENNVVIELEDIADEETKAFVMSLIMIQLMEYRINLQDSQKELKHIFLMEEAHRLLKNIPAGTGEGADPRGNAVEMFCNMLAELRSKGQGFMIADQIPSKLASDVIKNTNLKILHRIVAEEDRVLMGKSMHMTDEQIDFLSNLRQGQGIVYSENDNEPKMILAEYANKNMIIDRENLDHEEVLKICRPNDNIREKSNSFFCLLCPLGCDREKSTDIYAYLDELEFAKYVSKLGNNLNEDMFVAVITECLVDIKEKSKSEDLFWKYAFCITNEIVHLLDISERETVKLLQTLLKTLSGLKDTPNRWGR